MGKHRDIEVPQAGRMLSDMWIMTGNYKKTAIKKGRFTDSVVQ